ncbi:CsbD family protein [uncultured Rhodospira sp.]|uniref:CsbD family protein n=1 Tax=uncultured Rhodospira sp. TaxID=1936189 RepID=UPI0026141D36|nr:CsbD family protein [uncultured Rhodospira sp.]
MNKDELKGNWNQLKGNVRKQWGKLTDSDVEEASGDRDILVGKLQERYGIAKAEAEKQVDSLRA